MTVLYLKLRARAKFRCRSCLIFFFAVAIFLVVQGTAWAQPPGRYADVNGLKMYYELHGSGSPLLLLHGGGSTIQTTFGRILPYFTDTRLVIAPEQQGHGRTGDIDRPLSFDQMADDTAVLLDQLGIEKVDVLGFSNGGNVALALAIRHPAKVRRVVAASVLFDRNGLDPVVLDSFRTASVENMPAIYRDAYLEVAPNPQDLPVLVSKLMANLLQFEGLTETQLKQIKSPTLLLHGNNDVAALEHIVEFSRLISECQLAILPGGHGTYLGEELAHRDGSRVPELTATLVEEFLSATEDIQFGGAAE